MPDELLDTLIDYDAINQTGAIMGSGGMIVMDEDDCIVDVTKFYMEFCVDESCGKCVPCRMGTQHLKRILEDITTGKGEPDMLKQLELISDTMKKGALCGLGQTAPNPVLSTIDHFRGKTFKLDFAVQSRKAPVEPKPYV